MRTLKKYIYVYDKEPYGRKTLGEWVAKPKCTMVIEARSISEAHRKCAFEFGMGKRPWFCFLTKVVSDEKHITSIG